MSAELTVIRGRNLSGRTDLLNTRPGLYLGPEASHFLSGLASSVHEEVALGIPESPEPMLASFGIEKLAARNPFTLSEGEKTLVALTAIAMSEASEANLDCCLEQLDDHRRHAAITALRGRLQRLRIADNTLDEWLPRFPDAIDLSLPPRGDPPPRIDARAARNRLAAGACHLTLRSLCFGYERLRPVIERVDLELVPGRVCFLEGCNGAGKSTLSKLLAGILRPHSGTLEADDRPIESWRRPGALVAYHHQNPDVQLFAATVRGELRCAVSGSPGTEAQPWSAAFGLDPVLDHHPLELPFVLRKRVALASTLSRPRPWYILDEPTLGQDSENSRQIALILTRLAESGAGVIAISHSASFRALFPSARRVNLEAGKLSELG